MSGEQRREELIRILQTADAPVPGTELARKLDVSRQVIVQDIALIRAKNIDIYSTNKGYVLSDTKEYVRVFKVRHSEDEVMDELQMIVDLGGHVKDVFIYHKVYGVMRADLNIHSRKDVRNYMEGLKNGKSTFLMNITSGYHYHTVSAEDEQTLNDIQDELGKMGFLAKLQEYEPVDFWKTAEN